MRSPPAASGTRALSTGRKGATITMRLPPVLTARSAADHRFSPIQVPSRPWRSRTPKYRPARNVADQPATQPATTTDSTPAPPAGPWAAIAPRTATSPGTSTPTSGIASSIITAPNTIITRAVGRSPT